MGKHTKRQLRLPLSIKGLCRYCWRPLRSKDSLDRGYGSECGRQHRKATVSEVVSRYIEREVI